MKTYSKQKREKICNPTRNSNFLKRFKRNVMAIYKKNDDIGAKTEDPNKTHMNRSAHSCIFGALLQNSPRLHSEGNVWGDDHHGGMENTCIQEMVASAATSPLSWYLQAW